MRQLISTGGKHGSTYIHLLSWTALLKGEAALYFLYM
jgi:hypothetical protein